MSTTTILVEILIVGGFTLVWVIMLALGLSALNLKMLQTLLSLQGEQFGLVIGLSIALAYQLGTMMHLLSYGIFRVIRERKWQDSAAGSAPNFERMRAVVFQKASPEAVKDLLVTLATARLGRTGILNFFLIALSLVVYEKSWTGHAFLSLLMSLGCLPIWWVMASRYYRRMGIWYQVVVNEEEFVDHRVKSKASMQRVKR